MSPFGAMRALRSSIITNRVLRSNWPAAPVAQTFYRPVCARQSPPTRLSRGSMSSSNPKRDKRGVRTPNKYRASRRSPPPIGPRGVNFFPYLSIQLLRFDYVWGGGSLAFVWLEVWALTPLSPWGGLCARRFQRTSPPR